MTDERKGYPSASSMERLKLCPGSHKLIASLPERPQKEEPCALAGTEAHEELASGEETENITVEACREIACQFIATIQPNESKRELREERLWGYKNDPSLTFSGKPDWVIVFVEADHTPEFKRHAVLIDWKTGRKRTTHARECLQMRTLAVLVDANYGPFESLTVAKVQPWVKGQITVAKYERPELIDAEREIVEIIQASQEPDAPRRPGKAQCDYCPAKAWCPEAHGSSYDVPEKSLAGAARNYGIQTDGKDELNAVYLSNTTLSVLLERMPLAKKIFAAIEAEAKFRLEQDPASVPGYALRPGNMVRSVNDVNTVRSRLVFRGCHPDAVDRETEITGAAIERLLTPKWKGKALKEQKEQVMDGCTTSNQSNPSVVRVDGKELE